jgi:hypothetical protein
MTFKEYLSSLKPKSDSAGDLIRLAASVEFPECATRADLQRFIVATYGQGAMSDATETTWKGFEAALRKSQFRVG